MYFNGTIRSMSKGEKKAFACQENKHWSKRNIDCFVAFPFLPTPFSLCFYETLIQQETALVMRSVQMHVFLSHQCRQKYRTPEKERAHRDGVSQTGWVQFSDFNSPQS